MLRIMLADNHDVVRQGLRKILESREGWEICGEATDGRAAVEVALKLKPDVVIMDLLMSELNGLEATRQIRRELPETEILVFTMHEAMELIREVLAAGARGYVLKSEPGQRVIEAIEALSQHQPYFTPVVSETLLNAFLSTEPGREEVSAFNVLTERERVVIQLLAEGKGNKEVATSLGISHKTVESHRSAIMRKLGLHSLAHLRSSRGQLAGPLTEGTAAVAGQWSPALYGLKKFTAPGGRVLKFQRTRLAAARAAPACERPRNFWFVQPLPGKAAVVADMVRLPPVTRCGRRWSNCFAMRDFLLDDLVGAKQNRLWHRKAERLGGLEVHDHRRQWRQCRWHKHFLPCVACGPGFELRQSYQAVGTWPAASFGPAPAGGAHRGHLIGIRPRTTSPRQCTPDARRPSVQKFDGRSERLDRSP
jgi:DNA-binding NarL/FixJ family response regulator